MPPSAKLNYALYCSNTQISRTTSREACMNSGNATTRLIVNGKSAGRPDLRSAITNIRAKDIALDVRSTFEAGDVKRLIDEAIREGVGRLLIGGGDGSVNGFRGAIESRAK